MARLLPSTPDLSAAEEAAPRVIGLGEEPADDLLGAISSTTARQLLASLHEEPGTPSELADRVETSLQNVQYHLGNLDDAGLVEVIDTVYSEKGREMKVYAPADRPLVVVAGGAEETAGLRAVLPDLLGGAGLLALLSLLVQTLLEGLPFLSANTGTAGGGDGGMVAMDVGTPTPVAAPGGGLLPLDAVVGLLSAPGALFFLGGVVVLALLVALRYRG